MSDFLDDMAASSKARSALAQTLCSLTEAQQRCRDLPPVTAFKPASRGMSVIAEIKVRSPVEGTLAQAEAAGFTAPLPMFGLRMGYAITPKWSVNYLAESFFIEFEDKLKGALISYELNTEYKLFKNFAIGAGLARIGSSVEISDDDYKGKISDSYRGYTVFGTLYF